MIDYINYYFDLYPTEINTFDDKYYFYADNNKYYFVPYDRNVEELNELVLLNKQMIAAGSLVHEIIVNKFNDIINNLNGKSYVLLRVYVNENKKVNIIDIIDMLNEGEIINDKKLISRTYWSKLWEDKIDYFEYQITHIIKKYPVLYYIIDYYIGIGENAILYLKDVALKYSGKTVLGVCHKRIGANSTLFDLYNPLNLIIDYKVRDFAEYIKDAFFNNMDSKIIVNEMLKHYRFDKLNLALLTSRLLFPSYFFDKFESIVYDNISESSILKITKKSSDFEDFINYFIKICNLQTIGWISN